MDRKIFLTIILFCLTSSQVLSQMSTKSNKNVCIEGIVRYKGKIPSLRPIDTSVDKNCNQEVAIYPEFLVLGQGNTLGNVFVWIKDGVGNKKYQPPKENVILKFKKCTFVPHVFGIMVGQTLKVVNLDPTIHSFHPKFRVNKKYIATLPQFVQETTMTFKKEEVMVLGKCDAHPWEQCYFGIVSHPFFTVTQRDGKYKIGNLPTGVYELEAWHEKLGTQVIKIDAGKEKVKRLDFTFQLSPRKRKNNQ